MVPPESYKALLTLVILAIAIYSFVRERIPPDLTALLALLALLVTRILDPGEAFGGFSHPATVSVAAVLVLSAGIERTGALRFVARRILAPFGRFEFLLVATLMLTIGLLSAFINNTAAVAVFIPVALDLCRRNGHAPGRVLMPMSYAATFGGMCTLIGTSTNLVAHEFARDRGLPGFTMFELGRVGLPLLVAGYAYILFVGRLALPRRGIIETNGAAPELYVSELVLKIDSPWIGHRVRHKTLQRDFDVELLAVLRAGHEVAGPMDKERYAAGDALRIRGPLVAILHLARKPGFELHRPTADVPGAAALEPDVAEAAAPVLEERSVAAPAVEARGASRRGDEGAAQPDEMGLAEVVLLSTSGLVGRTLEDSRFAERFNVAVLALRRRGEISDRPWSTPLHPGDVLLVEGLREDLDHLAEARGFLTVGKPAHPEERPKRLAVALTTLAAVVVAVSFRLLPIVTAATAGCAVLMLTGCLRPREAYRAIDLSIVFLLAGTLALGTALEKTGVTTALATWLGGLQGAAGPKLILAAFFLVAVIVSELMSNSGTVALLGPVAVSCGQQIGINPMSLLAAVTFGASAAFAMPMGYQTSLMIYGPGGYRIRDFIRMGIPLDVIIAILSLWLIPHFWPLQMP